MKISIEDIDYLKSSNETILPTGRKAKVFIDGDEIKVCTACNVPDGWAIYAPEPLRAVDECVYEEIAYGNTRVEYEDGEILGA